MKTNLIVIQFTTEYSIIKQHNPFFMTDANKVFSSPDLFHYFSTLKNSPNIQENNKFQLGISKIPVFNRNNLLTKRADDFLCHPLFISISSTRYFNNYRYFLSATERSL